MKKIILTLIACTAIIVSSFAQGGITSFVPNNGLAGTSNLDIIVRGSGTHWDASISKANITFIGGGVTVNNVNVTGPEMMMINVAIDANATGDKSFIIRQGGNTYSSDAAHQPFSIISNSSPLSISLMVNPVQSISISDFDPNNLGASPVLFTVSIYNNTVVRTNITAKLSVRGEKVGSVGTATKIISSLASNQHLVFNNKDFDNYKLDQNNKSFFENAINTGTLPADDYDYELTLTESGNPNPIGTGRAKTVLSNPTTRPELITPGSSISMPADVIRNPLPIFQWFSQGDNFELNVYPVMDGQKTAEEVTNNRPMFKQTNLRTTTFVYPTSAEVLVDGKIYAWQIKRVINSSSGNNVLSSEVFWFRYQASSRAILTISDIKITPEETTVPAGASFKFNAQAFTVNNELITDAVFSWKVVPSSAGYIDANGLFTASSTPGSAAIVVKVGEYQEYATVNVAPSYMGNMTEANMRLFIQKLFGLTK